MEYFIVSICRTDIQYYDLGVMLSAGYFNPILTSCPLHPCQCLDINSYIQSIVVSSHSPNITLFIHSFICPMETNRAAKISQHYGWWALSLKKKAGVVSGSWSNYSFRCPTISRIRKPRANTGHKSRWGCWYTCNEVVYASLRRSWNAMQLEIRHDRRVQVEGRKNGTEHLGPEVETLTRSCDSGYKLKKSH